MNMIPHPDHDCLIPYDHEPAGRQEEAAGSEPLPAGRHEEAAGSEPLPAGRHEEAARPEPLPAAASSDPDRSEKIRAAMIYWRRKAAEGQGDIDHYKDLIESAKARKALADWSLAQMKTLLESLPHSVEAETPGEAGTRESARGAAAAS
jgi:hypothetical protein